MKNFRTELARLRRLVDARIEAARPKEVFRQVIMFEGIPLSAEQHRDLEYNRALKKPARVGFSIVRIQPQVDCTHSQSPSAADVHETLEIGGIKLPLTSWT